ncbi:hypothetical protein TeGR_g6147, partial [Tetraparma gracilis]
MPPPPPSSLPSSVSAYSSHSCVSVMLSSALHVVTDCSVFSPLSPHSAHAPLTLRAASLPGYRPPGPFPLAAAELRLPLLARNLALFQASHDLLLEALALLPARLPPPAAGPGGGAPPLLEQAADAYRLLLLVLHLIKHTEASLSKLQRRNNHRKGAPQPHPAPHPAPHRDLLASSRSRCSLLLDLLARHSPSLPPSPLPPSRVPLLRYLLEPPPPPHPPPSPADPAPLAESVRAGRARGCFLELPALPAPGEALFRFSLGGRVFQLPPAVPFADGLRWVASLKAAAAAARDREAALELAAGAWSRREVADALDGGR